MVATSMGVKICGELAIVLKALRGLTWVILTTTFAIKLKTRH